MNAFPIAIPAGCDGYEDGMTLRDYFAARVIVVFIADYYNSVDITQEDIAKRAYGWADAMLEAREIAI